MSNRLAENSNRNQSHFDYFEEYVEPTTETVNGENQDDRRKKQKEMHLWDVFKQFPSRPKSGSMVDNRNYEVLLQFLKVCVYLVIFLTLLVCSVVSKGTILFATSNVNSHYIPFCDVDSGLHLSEDVELAANVPENDRIAWIWCIIIAFVVPEFLGMLNAIRVCFFKTIKIEELPFIQNFLFSVIVEISHSVGMALLFLVCLPDLNTIQAASVMSCVCFIPSLLAFIESISKYLRRTGSKGFTSTLSDALAFTLQSIGVISSFFFKHKGRSESTYILPLALILASFRWWSNYVSTDEEPMNWLAKIKKDLEPSRLYMQGVTAIVRIFSFLAAAVLITYSKGIILAKFFNGFGIQQYIIPVISFSTESNSSRQEMILNTDSSVQIHVLVIQIVTSFFAYESGKFACKTLMHRFGFAFPLMLSVPITISILIIFYALRDQNACAFHGVIPDYLFFNIPTVKPFEIIFSEWYVWSAILWWLSQILITFHSWTSTCEKLARAERIFAVSTYDSLVIDQSLPLNRRKKSRSKNKHLPIKQNINIEGNDQLTIIKACVTMWHETENEMSKLVSSILRLDKDNCAMRVVQDHYNVRIPDYYDLETHIFFDDAFQCVHKCVTNCVNENETQVNNYVIEFVKVVEQSLRKMRMRARPPEKYPTPFGGRLKWTLPGGTNLIVHLKDKNKIRHKKRWSQVMYMYYLLGYNLMELPIEVERKETIAENTYILTLDGDIDFHPNAVKTLIDLMKRDESLGAACGRIHPIGSGPVVWFQKFEYAIGHWLQKSTEHMIGCVLCCPGCFSLFRGKALMDYNVIRKYATESTEARHYIQYDQGEDRWLCTLILQMGYRVEYSAASDAYTHVPENFDEFYIQRRRWIPSTMANIFDLLSTSKETRRCNNDISWIYILYQWILMGSTILGPGTIFLMLVGAFVAAFRIDNWTSLCCNLIPILTFIIVCLVCKESIQLKVAEIISAVYGLIMGIVLVGIMLQIVEDGWLAPSTLLFFVIAGQMIIGGLLHPREWTCLVCGIIYYITVPSMYMLLIIFAIFNLHNVSWGTRDSKGPDPTKPGTEETKDGSALNPDENKDNNKDQRNSNTKGSIEFSLAGLFKCMICTHKKESEEEIKLNSIAKMLSRIESRIDAIERKVVGVPSSVIDSVHSFENEKESTVYKSEKHSADYKSEKDTVDTVFSKKGCSSYKSDFNSYLKSEDSDYSEPESINESRIYSGSERNETDFVVNPSWMFDVELGKGGVSYLVTEEETFWIDVIATYLKPIVLDEETREKNAKVAKDLESLRDKYLFQFCMVNALFVIMVFLMQLNKDKLHLVWPFGATYNVTYEYNSQEDKAEIHIEKDYLRLEPIGCIFIITFVSILFIQFLAMLVHRFDTFSHLLAKTSLDWYCCKKTTDLPNEAIIVRYRDIFAKYVQTAYDKMIRDGETRSRKSPGSRKTLPDLMERRESSIMESFESLFHQYLDRSDLAEKSGKLTKPVIEAMRHRSVLHKNQERNNEDPIYDNTDNFQKNIASREQPHSRRSGYDNGGFDSD